MKRLLVRSTRILILVQEKDNDMTDKIKDHANRTGVFDRESWPYVGPEW